VNQVLVENGQAVGVALESGEELRAGIVVSNLDAKRTFTKIMDRNDLPPTLLVISQYDLEAILESAPATIARLRAGGSDTQLVWVPGFPHFYPTGAVTLGDDGTRMSVGERVIQFLDAHLQ